uniref:Probable serine carboxypeptidase CPVL n=1 Tax=Cacopsylla melanoneura TaxID=428564 RepID=A0A8D8V0N8_9HEMI
MFLFLVILLFSLSSPSFSSPSPPLYITPLLQSGQYAQAQSLSHLTGFLPGEPVSSYSAFFTIAEGTHLHFWFHPVEKDENWQSKPVALWLQGGYGLSTIRGGIQEYLIAYNVTPDGLVGKYDSGLTQYMNVLMIDNTRVGFSHTQDPSYPIVGSYELIADELYAALTQFFIMFPNLKRSIYIGGTSAGATKVTTLAELVLKRDRKIVDLAGVIIGDGSIQIETDLSGAGDYFNSFGMLEKAVARNLSTIAESIHSAIQAGDAALTRYLRTEVYTSEINKHIGYNGYEIQDIHHAFRFHDYWLDYVELPHIRDQLHVGDIPFTVIDPNVANFLSYELYGQKDKSRLEFVLKHGVPFCKYQGQYDGVFAYQGTIESLRSLDWPGADCLNTETFSRSQIWISGSLFGYIRRCPGLWEVLALRASHVVQLYQPAPLWKVVAAFVKETYKM